jgi:phosphatidylglycerophosphatase A
LKKSLADRLAEAIGTGLYSGYFPLFPGTVGSAAGLVLYVLLIWTGVLSREFSIGWPLTLGIVFVAGVLAAHRCERLFGHDAKRIVIDEVWGQLIALFLLPVIWYWVLAGFVVFRFFDVVKPFPARRAERIGGGLAVMLDDGVAAVYTVVILHVVKTVLG